MTVKKQEVHRAFADTNWANKLGKFYLSKTDEVRMFRPAFAMSLHHHRGALRLSGGFGVYCSSFETKWRKLINAQEDRVDYGLPMSIAIENWDGSLLDVENLYINNEEDLPRAISEIENLFINFPKSDQEFLNSIKKMKYIIEKPVNFWLHLENPVNKTNLYSKKSIEFMRHLKADHAILFSAIWDALHDWQRAILDPEFV